MSAGAIKPPTIFASALNFLQPFPTRAALRNCADLTTEFFTRLSPLANRIGQYWIQLPATFGPQDLPALWAFIDTPAGHVHLWG